MLGLILVLAGIIVCGIGAWLANARLVGIGAAALGVAMLLPYVD